ncbi:hypothetical protein [Nonomuraea fuscirosea]|uniref:hypothetical protein n=1 Tax=Nonomuraea fuscirosea TaxID=1291556 RepID=UPI0034294ED6
MSNFEDRLLGALKEEITTRTAEDRMTTTVTPVRRSRGRLVGLSAAVAGVAAAALAVVVLTGLTGGPAYAVTKDADGGVSVRINAFTDPEGLESELAGAGIKAVVDYLPEGRICKQPRGRNGAASGRLATGIGVGEGGSGITFTIEQGQVPEGATLVLAVSKSGAGDNLPPFATALEVVDGEVAPCEAISVQAPPPSDGRAPDRQGDGPLTDSRTDDGGPGLTTERD